MQFIHGKRNWIKKARKPKYADKASTVFKISCRHDKSLQVEFGRNKKFHNSYWNLTSAINQTNFIWGYITEVEPQKQGPNQSASTRSEKKETIKYVVQTKRGNTSMFSSFLSILNNKKNWSMQLKWKFRATNSWDKRGLQN